jgi:small subunit ribosomal protein S8
MVGAQQAQAETVKKFAAIRAELKAKRDYAGLAKLPRDASPTRVVNRCSMSGRRRGYCASSAFASDLPRSGVERFDSRCDESQLVIFMSDPISDMLTRIRNAGRALLPAVELPHSHIKESVANILKQRRLRRRGGRGRQAPEEAEDPLKYNGKKSVIEGLKRVSKPGLRKYVGATEIPRVRGGLGVSISPPRKAS